MTATGVAAATTVRRGRRAATSRTAAARCAGRALTRRAGWGTAIDAARRAGVAAAWLHDWAIHIERWPGVRAVSATAGAAVGRLAVR